MNEEEQADIMERVFDVIDKKEIPNDDDLLHFHRKGCKLLDVSNGWNGIDKELELIFNFRLLYPIIHIKNVLIISN